MTVKPYRRSLFQRIAGKPQTQPPADSGCWVYADGELMIDLSRAPELAEPWGAIDIDSKLLPVPVLVFRDNAGEYHAFCNVCAHGGRKLDPVGGTETICCCSLGKSTYDYRGQVISGAAESNIRSFGVSVAGDRLMVSVQ